MIRSMTGFGRGESSFGGFQVTVEVKTLNSRYLDISSRVPQSIQHHEFDIKEIVQSKLARGKVHINAYVDRTDNSKPSITYNSDMVQAYGKMLEQVKFLANIQEPVKLSDLLEFEGVFETRQEDEKEVEVIWKCMTEALQKATNLLNEMRSQEGKELKNELVTQVTGISEMIEEVSELAVKRIPDVRERLQNRIKTMVADEKIDPERMEMEIALLVDKMDINEEIIRLQSHLKFFLEALENDEPMGRRLNFLCQEINRELNTIGAKANDSTISHHIVLGKEKLEQIREQVQNIE
jgi:uncharacterized protein (TIGR00255 family)